MGLYTLTNNLIENIESSDIYLFGSVLGVFNNIMSGHKLAIDKNKVALGIYTQAHVNEDVRQYYATWLQLFSEVLDKVCEFVPVELDDSIGSDEAFLKIASSINGKRNLIVYSRNNNCPYRCNDRNEIVFNGITINTLDKDEASIELNNKIDISTNGANSPIIIGNHNKNIVR